MGMGSSGRSRHLLLSSSVVIAFVCSAPGQSGTSDTNAVRRVLSEQVAAWNAGSIDGYMRGYWESDSTVFVSGGSLIRGHRTVKERYEKKYGSRSLMGTLSFEELSVGFLTESVARASGIWRLKREKDSPWGRFTLILEKKPEGWKVTYDHTSSGE